MVVDDDPDMIYTIKQVFEDQYKITGVNDGEKFLDLLKKDHIPDAIIMDIMMPGLNGLTIFEILLKHPIWKNIPLLFLSATSDQEIKSYCDIISKGFIEKPFDPELLKNKIKEILDN